MSVPHAGLTDFQGGLSRNPAKAWPGGGSNQRGSDLHVRCRKQRRPCGPGCFAGQISDRRNCQIRTVLQNVERLGRRFCMQDRILLPGVASHNHEGEGFGWQHRVDGLRGAGGKPAGGDESPQTSHPELSRRLQKPERWTVKSCTRLRPSTG